LPKISTLKRKSKTKQGKVKLGEGCSLYAHQIHGRRHGFESGGGAICERSEPKKFLTPTFWPVGDKILLR